jgi:hypothetical protein
MVVTCLAIRGDWRRDRRSGRRWLVILSFLGVLAMTGLPAASARREALPPYPIPNGYAFLDGGRIHRYPWVALLYASHGRPCVELEMASEGMYLCERPFPLAVSSLSTGRAGATRSLVGLVGAPTVRRVYLNYVGRADETVRLRPISKAQARTAHVSSTLRTAVQPLFGPFCLRRYVAYGAGGRRLYASLFHMCPE